MELLIPSLVAMLLAVGASFFIYTYAAPTVLIVVGSFVLAMAIYSHFKRFGITEYERATWYKNLGDYSAFIVFGIILFSGYYMYASGFGSSTSNGAGYMRPISMPSSIGGGMGTVVKTVHSRLSELMRKGRITVN
jgi:hypothetical protein